MQSCLAITWISSLAKAKSFNDNLGELSTKRFDLKTLRISLHLKPFLPQLKVNVGRNSMSACDILARLV